jgi:hypothetical protein
VRSHETHSGLDRHARPARPAISGLSNELLSNQVEGRLIATSGNFFTVADLIGQLPLDRPPYTFDTPRVWTTARGRILVGTTFRTDANLTSRRALRLVNATALIEIYVMRQAAGGHRSVL